MKKSTAIWKKMKEQIAIHRQVMWGALPALVLLFLAGCSLFGPRMTRVGAPPENLDVGALMQSGRQVYQDKCAKCHGLQGLGIPGIYYAMAGDPVVTQADAGEVIEIIVYGTTKPASYFSSRNQMAPFGFLTDQEVAAAATYIRNSWGNQASAVAPAQVAKVRKGGY